jgi:HK97 gp10 family phage protein
MAKQVHVEGLKELHDMAGKVAPRVAIQLARATVHKIAGLARNAMKKRAPKDEGTLRKAIVAVRRRGTPDMAVSDVRIAHGKGQKNDAWYWHFKEYGTVNQSATPFIQPTIAEFESQIPAIYREEFGRKLEQRLARDAKR